MAKNMLAEAYRKALEFYHSATAPIDGTTKADKTGVGGRVGKNAEKTEAQKALDELDAPAEKTEAELEFEAKEELAGRGKTRAK